MAVVARSDPWFRRMADAADVRRWCGAVVRGSVVPDDLVDLDPDDHPLLTLEP